MVHYSQVHLYKPAPGEDVTLYERAQQNNPDVSWYLLNFKSINLLYVKQYGPCFSHWISRY